MASIKKSLLAIKYDVVPLMSFINISGYWEIKKAAIEKTKEHKIIIKRTKPIIFISSDLLFTAMVSLAYLVAAVRKPKSA